MNRKSVGGPRERPEGSAAERRPRARARGGGAPRALINADTIMDINKYTEKAQEAILAAQSLADREGHPEILPEHLLLTLLEQKDGIVPDIIRKMNADPAELTAQVKAELERQPRAHGGSQVGMSARLRKVFDAAEQEAERLKD